LSFIDHGVKEKYHGKETPEEELCKYQGFSFIVRKNMLYIFRTKKVVKPL
jgi:hypothetical protein